MFAFTTFASDFYNPVSNINVAIENDYEFRIVVQVMSRIHTVTEQMDPKTHYTCSELYHKLQARLFLDQD